MSRVDSDSDEPQRLGGGWVAVQAVMLGFFLVALVLGEPIGEFEGRIYVQSFGLLIALVGVGLSVWSWIQHGAVVSPFPAPREGATLIETGPYRFVRHPMYTGVIAFVFGTGVTYLVPAAILVAPALFIFFLVKSAREEEMLADAIAGYRQYRADVPWKLIPKVI